MASMGKCDIGISSYNEAKKIENEKLPVFILYPTDGVPWYLYGIALSADSKYLDRGERFINWLLNPVRYKGIMKDKGYHYIYINDIGISPDINGTKLKYWELEKKYTDEGKKILLNQWMDKIRFGRSS